MAAEPSGLDAVLDDRQGRPFVDADTEHLAENYVYEIVDGMLLVSPRPAIPHRRLAIVLLEQLRAARPESVDVLYEVDFKPDETRTLVPDIAVAHLDAFGDKALVGTPLLLVEVRSPSSTAYDRRFKRALYEEAGVPTYWLADPDGPTLTVLELGADGTYAETARLVGPGELGVQRPFPMTVTLP